VLSVPTNLKIHLNVLDTVLGYHSPSISSLAYRLCIDELSRSAVVSPNIIGLFADGDSIVNE